MHPGHPALRIRNPFSSYGIGRRGKYRDQGCVLDRWSNRWAVNYTERGTKADIPERAAGSPAAPASDLYSLGVVAYECLAGQPPFRGSPLEVTTARWPGTPPSSW